VLSPRSRDGGSLTVLIIGYATIAMVLVIVGIDVSKVFLARRALSAATDAAAVAAAQGVDRSALYAGPGPRCGGSLPLSRQHAAELAAESMREAHGTLRRVLATVDQPRTSVSGSTVSVTGSGEVAVPFGRVLGWLSPHHHDGRVHVAETSSARSPVTGC
jgi:hypothetical protein